jgi:polyhydroxyalkanoate synthesis repressor PhaR
MKNDVIRIIKKYPNRRLYDTSIGAYIKLDDIKRLVLDYQPFQVIDAKTKKDLTQNTLLQIIAEQELTRDALFTIPMLQQFIRLSQEKSHAAFTEYLAKTMQLFADQKDVLQQQWEMYQQSVFNPGIIWRKTESTHTTESYSQKKTTKKKNT